MSEYLAKPFKGHELFAMVERGAEGTAAPEHTPLATLAPPVDLEGFRSTLREAGAEQALYSIIDTFVRQAPDRLAALATAVTSGTGPDIAKAAHVYRGAAATIGARELAELLERVETTAHAGSIDEARDTFEDVSPVAHNVTEYLRQQRALLPEE
jgi:HPt (histidine-containing phosphotransfer) domain-containing protein